LFIGHGSPMNALQSNAYTAAWRDLGSSLPEPRAILTVSAHWYTRCTAITAMSHPPTIHDFGGFPQGLFDIRYPAPGAPELAQRVASLLSPLHVTLDQSWGLDHGTWSVLVHMYPQANIPVLQLSIDATQPAIFHFELGQRLRALRDEGIMIFGNGNVVHNLRMMRTSGTTPEWATHFNNYIRDAVMRGDDAAVINYEQAGEAAVLSVPTPEHFLPLLYVLGAREQHEKLRVLTDGIEFGGAISMLSVGAGI
jgi:4,5-DOPA dioxygenase extradiol